MAPCGKYRTVSLQKLPSPISSDENILGYEGEISLGKTACKAQETRKGIHLAFCFSCSCVHLSLPGLQCKFSLLFMETIYFETRVWGKGSERGAKGCNSVWAELCAGDGSWLGNAGFLPATASTSSIHWWAKHKTLAAKDMYKNANTSIHLPRVHLLLMLVPYDHNIGSCPLHSIS